MSYIDKNSLSEEALIFELGSEEREGVSYPRADKSKLKTSISIDPSLLRDRINGMPEVSEVEVVRHYTHLSQWNYGVDSGMYPLGSCTMKYNPKVNEMITNFEGFSLAHPHQPEELSQGILRIMYELEQFLSEITGLDRVTLQPAAGAHGELTGMLMIKAYHKNKNSGRFKVLVPDTAHGTNPASVSMCGMKPIKVESNKQGVMDIDTIKKLIDDKVAAIMFTNPNTLGLFESNIVEISELMHKEGGLVYCDGANLNALLGITKLGDLGVDVVHMNLHKTFSTPHGGGGPGAGPVAVRDNLSDFLPIPVVEKIGESYKLNYEIPKSIGKVRSFYGNFLVMVKAYAYILSMGAEGLRKTSEAAVVNANYIRSKLKNYYYLPYDEICMHECVFTDKNQHKFGVTTLDIAKRLIDYGFHPPTIYFPLVVSGALMVEPTETEPKETIDKFIESMIKIYKEAESNPEVLKEAPHFSKVSRVDEVKAARNPILKWEKKDD